MTSQSGLWVPAEPKTPFKKVNLTAVRLCSTWNDFVPARGTCGFTPLTAALGISSCAPGCHFTTRSDIFSSTGTEIQVQLFWGLVREPVVLLCCAMRCSGAGGGHGWNFLRICAMCLPCCCRGSGLLRPSSSSMDLRIYHRRFKYLTPPCNFKQKSMLTSTFVISSMNSGGHLRLLWVYGLGEVNLEPGTRTQDNFFLGRKGSNSSNGQERAILWGSDRCIQFLRREPRL